LTVKRIILAVDPYGAALGAITANHFPSMVDFPAPFSPSNPTIFCSPRATDG